KPKGAGYELEKELLVTSSDTWFRLSDVCVAPDGSVFLADWYDPGVGGHGMGDWTRGRIFRVTPKGHKGYKVPKVDVERAEGLLAALGSPNLANRYLATQGLQLMKVEDSLRTLLPALAPESDEILRGRAYWQLVRILAPLSGPQKDSIPD